MHCFFFVSSTCSSVCLLLHMICLSLVWEGFILWFCKRSDKYKQPGILPPHLCLYLEHIVSDAIPHFLYISFLYFLNFFFILCLFFLDPSFWVLLLFFAYFVLFLRFPSGFIIVIIKFSVSTLFQLMLSSMLLYLYWIQSSNVEFFSWFHWVMCLYFLWHNNNKSSLLSYWNSVKC